MGQKADAVRFAHSAPGKSLDLWETLRAHSVGVAEIAAACAGAFGFAEVAEQAASSMISASAPLHFSPISGRPATRVEVPTTPTLARSWRANDTRGRWGGWVAQPPPGARVLDHARSKAAEPTGLFTLTVPTGGVR